MQNGMKMEYPLDDLILGLSMHAAPRLLSTNGMVSPVILPKCSILAGCMRSVDFARLTMHDPMQTVSRRAPEVSSFSFVDDVAQTTMGSLLQVAQNTVKAGIVFVSRIRSARLRISSKSVIVSTSPRLSRIIERSLRSAAGIGLRIEASSKDLGILNNPSGRRSTVIQSERFRKAKARLGRIAPLAKAVRRARALAYTGALP